MPVAGMPYDHARNTAAKACLDNGFEWLFSLDSDVIPPRDAILRLLAHKQPFISGLYHRRSPPDGVPVMIRNGSWVTDYPPGKVVEVHLVGAGCLLTHRSVVEYFFKNPQRPGKPMFDWRVDLAGLIPPGKALSEDFTTCDAWRAQGGHILVDTSVECKHVGYSEYRKGGSRPLDTNPNT